MPSRMQSKNSGCAYIHMVDSGVAGLVDSCSRSVCPWTKKVKVLAPHPPPILTGLKLPVLSLLYNSANWGRGDERLRRGEEGALHVEMACSQTPELTVGLPNLALRHCCSELRLETPRKPEDQEVPP